MDLANVCRLCTKEDAPLISIFGDEYLDNTQFLDQIRDILRIEFQENDGLPQKICDLCTNTMQKILDTVYEFRKNDARMRQHLLGKQRADMKEEFDDTMHVPVTCSLENVKIELLESEEWLEGDENHDSIVESKNEAKDKTRKKKRTPVRVKTKQALATEEEKPTPKRKGRRTKADTENGSVRKRKRNVQENPNRPRLNDYICYICKSEPLGSAQNLLDHLNTHNDQLPFTCTLCKQETIEIKQIRSLNLHLKMHEQPIKCQYCDRRYGNERARDYHVQSFHLGDNAPCPTPCDVCGKMCSSLLSLRVHMKGHTVSFNCEYCTKVFTLKSKLKRHVDRVHEKTAGFECKICQKRLNTIDSYELHVRTIHEGRRDHKCDVCGHRFTTAAFLRMHQAHYEEGSCKPKNNWQPHYSARVSDEGIKLYTCKVCGKEDLRSIREHLRAHFPDDYDCPICFKKFVSKSAFDRHRLTHEEIVHNCLECKKNFLNPMNLARHMAKMHSDEQQPDVSDVLIVTDEESMEYEVV